MSHTTETIVKKLPTQFKLMLSYVKDNRTARA
jgi:hypothetical protein